MKKQGENSSGDSFCVSYKKADDVILTIPVLHGSLQDFLQ